MGRDNKTIGAKGEYIAQCYLLDKGYKAIARNLRTPFGEIDLVARHKGFTVFVEIKSRLGDSLGPPFLSITGDKKRRMIKNALFYVKKHGIAWSNWRIDVVSVKLRNLDEAERIEHFENAIEDNQ